MAFLDIFKKKKKENVGGMEDFMTLIRVYFQSVLAANLGISNLSALPDLLTFKRQMLSAVEDYVKSADIFIGCAAVADFRAETISPVKIKKSDDADTLTIKLVKNPDIVATVGKLESNRPFTVGFAAETNNLHDFARAKLQKKHLDLIVLNDVSNKEIGFNSDENEVTVFDKDGQIAHFEKQPKPVIAQYLMELIFTSSKKKNN